MVANVIKLSEKHWVYVYSALSPDNKESLKRYFKRIYPRDYVKKLIAAIEGT